jgi:methyl-accepting chemotaxis protein
MSILDMKVGTKLGFGFGVIILLLVAILIIAIFNMASFNSETQQIVGERYVKVELANTIEKNTLDVARKMRNMVLTIDPSKQEQLYRAIDKDRTENKENLERMDKLITLPAGRKVFDIVTQNRTALQEKFMPFLTCQKKIRNPLFTISCINLFHKISSLLNRLKI